MLKPSDAQVLAAHAANLPDRQSLADIAEQTAPFTFLADRPVEMLRVSPPCAHFSMPDRKGSASC